MTDASPPQQPRTEAGRALLRSEWDGTPDGYRALRAHVFAIEAEARAVEPPLPARTLTGDDAIRAGVRMDAGEPPLPVDPDMRERIKKRIGGWIEFAEYGPTGIHVEDAEDFEVFLDAVVEAAASVPLPVDGLREALGEAVNALEWCDTRYKQTLAGRPVLDVDELRAYIARTLTDARAALAAPTPAPPALDVEQVVIALEKTVDILGDEPPSFYDMATTFIEQYARLSGTEPGE